MYKKQLTFQKIICMLCVIAVAVMFVYALGISTDLHDNLRSAIRNPSKLDSSRVEGARIFYDMQDFNREFVNRTIVLLLLSVLLFLTNTHVRRRYYIANYVSVGIFSAAALYIGIWAHQQVEGIKWTFQNKVNFEQLKTFLESRSLEPFGREDVFWFDSHYAVIGLCFVAVALLIANVIWKTILMRNEKKLLEAGKEAA